MITKSPNKSEHVADLRKLFKQLFKYKLKSNPAKYTFDVTFSKLLGFIVSKKGIKVDPNKVKAIQNLPPPQTSREVRRFLRKLNYIAKFISPLTEKCDQTFGLL